MNGKTMVAPDENKKMPALFIGHGSPLNSISRNSFTDSLIKLGKNLPEPDAIMVISAHWLTKGTQVSCEEKPGTIHDFIGFPEELYAIEYPSPGSPYHARLVSGYVKKTHIKYSKDWGLDHAAWTILKFMYPEANIPVFEMSLDYSFNETNLRSLQYHYDLAKDLSELRKNGVLIIGSGNIVHNLGLIDFHNIDAKPFEWAVEFDEKVKMYLINKNHDDLINYERITRSASMAVPTLDHYLPMIYTIALQEEDEPLTFTYEGFQNGSISMRCFQIG